MRKLSNYGEFSSDQLIDALTGHVLRISFVKINGDDREMICTLMSDVISPLLNNGIYQNSDSHTVIAWDLEVEDWRAFRASRVYSVSLVPDSKVNSYRA